MIEADKEKIRKYIIALLLIKHRDDLTQLKEEIFEDNKVYINNDLNNIDDNNSPSCDICNFVVHRANYSNHLKSKKKHLENEKRFQMIIPDWLFQEYFENIPKNI